MSNFALFRFWLTVLGIILMTPAALWWFDLKNRYLGTGEPQETAKTRFPAQHKSTHPETLFFAPLG